MQGLQAGPVRELHVYTQDPNVGVIGWSQACKTSSVATLVQPLHPISLACWTQHLSQEGLTSQRTSSTASLSLPYVKSITILSHPVLLGFLRILAICRQIWSLVFVRRVVDLCVLPMPCPVVLCEFPFTSPLHHTFLIKMCGLCCSFQIFPILARCPPLLLFMTVKFSGVSPESNTCCTSSDTRSISSFLSLSVSSNARREVMFLLSGLRCFCSFFVGATRLKTFALCLKCFSSSNKPFPQISSYIMKRAKSIPFPYCSAKDCHNVMH